MEASIEVPDEWRRLIEALAASSWRRVLVLGAADRGKSTFCRILTRHLDAAGVAAAFGAEATARFDRAYPATVNEAESTRLTLAAARAVAGEDRVREMPRPTMGGEDFSFMLNAKQGAYIMLGARRCPDEAMVHHPRYDFNDAILPVGASYWATLAERLLPRG